MKITKLLDISPSIWQFQILGQNVTRKSNKFYIKKKKIFKKKTYKFMQYEIIGREI